MSSPFQGLCLCHTNKGKREHNFGTVDWAIVYFTGTPNPCIGDASCFHSFVSIFHSLANVSLTVSLTIYYYYCGIAILSTWVFMLKFQWKQTNSLLPQLRHFVKYRCLLIELYSGPCRPRRSAYHFPSIAISQVKLLESCCLSRRHWWPHTLSLTSSANGRD